MEPRSFFPLRNSFSVPLRFRSEPTSRIASSLRSVPRVRAGTCQVPTPTLHSTNAGREFRAEQTCICSLIRQAANRGRSTVDRSSRESAVLKGNAETRYNNLVERQPRLGIVPLHKFIDRMPITSLRFNRT